ncbi:MAG: PAS domain S-box protein [Desulfamplus sp.]|nr:PAS domain S-box protein [Desulfamplus sp.]
MFKTNYNPLKRDDNILNRHDFRLSLSFGAVVLILMLITSGVAGYLFGQVNHREENRLSGAIASILGESIVRISFSGKYHARLFAEEMLSRVPELAFISIETSDGRILAHSNPEKNDQFMTDKEDDKLRILSLKNGSLTTIEHIHDGKTVKEMFLPYRGGHDGTAIGVVRTGINFDKVRKEQRRNLFTMFIFIGLMTGAAIWIVLILSRYFGKEVRSLATQLDGILNNAPIAIVIRDRAGKVLAFSRKFETLFGRPEPNGTLRELLETRLSELRLRDFSESCQHIFKTGLETSEELDIDIQGSVSTFYVRKFSIAKDNKGNNSIICIFMNDITDRKKAEIVLAEKEAFLRTLVQTIPDLIWLKDAEGIYLSCNTRFECLYGKSKTNIIGKTDYDFVDRELADFFRDNDRKAMAAGRPTRNEEWLTFASDGYRGLFDTVKTPMFDVDGNLIGVLGIAHDITERELAEEKIKANNKKLALMNQELNFVIKEMEKINEELITTSRELETNENRFRSVVEKSLVGIAIVNDSFLYTYVNEEFCTMTGYTENEIVGQNFTFLLSEESKELAAQRYRLRQKGEDVPSHYEFSFVQKNGEKRIGEVRSAIYMDSSGRVNSIIQTIDITERRKMEDSLLKSEQKFRAMFEESPIGVMLCDNQGVILECNNHFADIFGVAREKYYGMNLLERISKGSVWQNLANARSDYELHTYEGPYVSVLSGKQLHISASSRKLSPDMVLTIIMDMTQHIQAEEENQKLQQQLLQAQKMESIGRLAGGVAHDFNNMLGVIIGHAEILLDNLDSTEPSYQGLYAISKAASRSANLTKQLLAFARKQTVNPQIVDLNNAVEGMLSMLERLIGENIELIWIPADNIAKVMVDPTQMDQIMANLCINARDAIQDMGKITIETHNAVFDAACCLPHPDKNTSYSVDTYGAYHPEYADDIYRSANPEAPPGAYVMLAVSDNGCGMDRETMSHIFDPFFTTKEMNKGTGLGLASVYGSVRQNNGFINVYSELGEGTTFRIYLPVYEAQPNVYGAGNADESAIVEQSGTADANIVEQYKTSEEPESGVESNISEPSEITNKIESVQECEIPCGSETILLVEDEEWLLELGETMLKRLGYKVLRASTPEEAINITLTYSGEIDLLITDVIMPEMNGWELSIRLRKINPYLRCLFMSGYTANVIAHHGVLDSGVHFIQKPFSIQELAQKVREGLS